MSKSIGLSGLVVVSGLPASGKSSLSRSLADALGLVWISRDRLRRSLDGVAGALAHDSGWLVGRALDGLINETARSVLAAGGGAVVDSNFNLPQQADAVRDLVEELNCPCFEICLWGDIDVLRQRFVDRADPPLTEDLRPYLEEVLARKRTPVLAPPVPIVEVDTTTFAGLEHLRPAIVEQIRQALGPSPT